MRPRRPVRLAIVLFLLLPFEAVAQRKSPGKAPRPPVGAGDGDVLARILQREDSRWIGGDRFLADLSRSRNATTKMRALLALGRIGDPRALPLLFDRLGEPSALIRARALFAIGQILDAHNLEHEGYELQRDWLPAIAALTGDPDSRVRMRAIEALGKSADSTYGDRGSWTLRFFGADAPLTVYNFITLVQRGLLDTLTFPRVVPDFVIQGGDPRNDTDGGPGYAIRCEINEQTFARGTVGMALSGKDTGGSQYFITLSPQPQLDGGYTAFAQVSDGLAVVDRILLGDRVRRIELLSQAASLVSRPGGSLENSGAEKSNPSDRKRQ